MSALYSFIALETEWQIKCEKHLTVEMSKDRKMMPAFRRAAFFHSNHSKSHDL